MKSFILTLVALAALMFTAAPAMAGGHHGHHHNHGHHGHRHGHFGGSLHFHKVYHPTYLHWTPYQGWHTHGHYHTVPHFGW
jgi:hypothetical protein